MKKLLLGLFVFGFLVMGFQVNALDNGCSSGVIFNSTTGARCPVVPSVVSTCPLNMPNPFTLCSDGKIEPATRDANQCVTSYKCVTPESNDGCSHGEVYSSTTGAQCPITTPSITVLSPNGGEVYQAGQQITVKWKTSNYTQPRVNIFLSIPSINWVLHIDSVINDGEEVITIPTLSQFGLIYKIWIDNNGNGAPLPSNNNFGDDSDNLFTIKKSITEDGCLNGEVYSSTTGQKCPGNNIPIISGVSGPQTLNVGQAGTWKVTASSSNGGNLSYSVDWGDSLEVCGTGCVYALMHPSQQSATFTHSYTWARTFVPKFTVTSENTIRCITTPCPSNGGSASTSLSVKVFDPSDNTLPAGCTSTVGYSPITGLACNGSQGSGDGCLPGYIFSPITGQKCNGVKTCPVISKPSSDFCINSTVKGNYDSDNCLISYECLPSDYGCNGAMFSSTTGQLCPTTTSNTTSSNSGTSTSITRTLKKGIKGDDVKILQLFLNLVADGSFGPETQKKVMEWQAQNGLKVDGAFGIQSAEKAGLAD